MMEAHVAPAKIDGGRVVIDGTDWTATASLNVSNLVTNRPFVGVPGVSTLPDFIYVNTNSNPLPLSLQGAQVSKSEEFGSLLFIPSASVAAALPVGAQKANLTLVQLDAKSQLRVKTQGNTSVFCVSRYLGPHRFDRLGVIDFPCSFAIALGPNDSAKGFLYPDELPRVEITDFFDRSTRHAGLPDLPRRRDGGQESESSDENGDEGEKGSEDSHTEEEGEEGSEDDADDESSEADTSGQLDDETEPASGGGYLRMRRLSGGTRGTYDKYVRDGHSLMLKCKGRSDRMSSHPHAITKIKMVHKDVKKHLGVCVLGAESVFRVSRYMLFPFRRNHDQQCQPRIRCKMEFSIALAHDTVARAVVVHNKTYERTKVTTFFDPAACRATLEDLPSEDRIRITICPSPSPSPSLHRHRRLCLRLRQHRPRRPRVCLPLMAATCDKADAAAAGAAGVGGHAARAGAPEGADEASSCRAEVPEGCGAGGAASEGNDEWVDHGKDDHDKDRHQPPIDFKMELGGDEEGAEGARVAVA
ncbi:unnamed protein product [Vitrella brassicaformis CCMP3155]|uniref:Uncharacterized protein n=1 Tax=Vitrella brassicaformis (strain CCMP3155) TaxID=1169540 RepID=A0A0G4GRS4_VITBC|nr:unnamed protein product [Vitrella brassicaformis CCMP3155]|eukprot:CEM33247.1 unnamed protein product [Vitrella brassicaformis CCMP3155]